MNHRIVIDDLSFPEGPVLLPDGDIAVCEIRAGRIRRVSPDGRSSVLAQTGGGPNGAAIGPDGALYVCNNGGDRVILEKGPDGREVFRAARPGEQTLSISGQIQRVTLQGKVETLYDAVDGRELMSPNDIVFDATGGFYFTDIGRFEGEVREAGVPEEGPYVSEMSMLAAVTRNPPGSIYYARPDGSAIHEVSYPLAAPNGVGLSPDGGTLYVAESATGRLWAYDITAPGRVGARRCVGIVPGAPPLNFSFCDSLAVDSKGNILVATIINGGVTVFSPDGHSVRHVATGDVMTTNCCFSADERTLYVTLSGQGKLIAFDNWPG